MSSNSAVQSFRMSGDCSYCESTMATQDGTNANIIFSCWQTSYHVTDGFSWIHSMATSKKCLSSVLFFICDLRCGVGFFFFFWGRPMRGLFVAVKRYATTFHIGFMCRNDPAGSWCHCTCDTGTSAERRASLNTGGVERTKRTGD